MTAPVLIYGGSGGIGAAIARALSSRGIATHLVGRDLQRLSEAAAASGSTHSTGDVLDPSTFARVTAEAAGDGALSGLIYAVGSINLKPVARLTDADFLRDFEINALGAVRAVQAALPALKKAESASILLFSTVAVAQGFTAHASVAMAKGAVEGLTLALAAELAPKIRVNCIAPSLTRTRLASALTGSEQLVKAIGDMHAIPRLGEPDDIGPLAALLMSPDAGWITGQVIGIDGGRSTLRTRG